MHKLRSTNRSHFLQWASVLGYEPTTRTVAARRAALPAAPTKPRLTPCHLDAPTAEFAFPMCQTTRSLARVVARLHRPRPRRPLASTRRTLTNASCPDRKFPLPPAPRLPSGRSADTRGRCAFRFRTNCLGGNYAERVFEKT